MPKAKIAEETKILSIRFPEALIKKLDRYVKRFQKEFPGISFQRTDAIRLFVERGLKGPMTPDHRPPDPPRRGRPPKPEAEKKTGSRGKTNRKPAAGKTRTRKKR